MVRCKVFFLHRAYGSAFSVKLHHLPLLFTSHEADFRLWEGSTWVVLPGVPPSSVDPNAWLCSQELGYSWHRVPFSGQLTSSEALAWKEGAEGPFSLSQRVCSACSFLRLGNATYYLSLEDHSNLQTLE